MTSDRMSLARDLIMQAEGFRSHAYWCAGDPPGLWTIGYGHCDRLVHRGMVISEATARRYLDQDMQHAAHETAKLVHVPLGEPGFAALISFSYNVGTNAFAGSTLLALLNERKYLAAAEEFGKWTHADGAVLPGLSRRRQRERALFLEGIPRP